MHFSLEIITQKVNRNYAIIDIQIFNHRTTMAVVDGPSADRQFPFKYSIEMLKILVTLQMFLRWLEFTTTLEYEYFKLFA